MPDFTKINDPVEIPLVKPLVVNGVEVKVLHMRRPTMVNQIAMRKQSAAKNWTGEEQDLFMYASLCDVTPAALMDLDMADYLELCNVYANFLVRPQKNSDEQQKSLLGAMDGSQ